jgi:hypothetical protein
MAEEQLTAPLLTGYRFFHHPNNPTLGILRLDTKEDPRWVLVTRDGLLALAVACAKHADQLKTVQ